MKGRDALVRTVTVVTILVFTGGIILSGEAVDRAWLRFLGVAIFVSTLVLTLWDNLLWRLAIAQMMPKVPRCLRGTWKGTLTTQWRDPGSGEVPEPKLVYLVVRQRASWVSVVLLTDESRSSSTLATVRADDTSSSLDYIYLNKPDLRVNHRSMIHHGSTTLLVTGRPAVRLTGRYWTDRDSKGELIFDQRRRKVVDDYEAAEELFSGG